MPKWKIYYTMDGEVTVDGPETEEEVREAFHNISTKTLAEHTYGCRVEIDDLCRDDD